MSTELMTTEITKELTAYDSKTRNYLHALADQAKPLSIAACALGEKEGYAVVNAMRLKLKAARCMVSNWRKDVTAPLNAAVKTAISMEKDLISIVEVEENRLQAEEFAYEAEQLRKENEIKEAAKRKQATRMIALQNVGQMTQENMTWAQDVPDKPFEEFIERESAKKAERDRIQAEKDAELARLQAIEAKRIAAEQAEAEEKRKADERAAKDAAAEAKRIADEQAQEIAKLRAELAAKTVVAPAPAPAPVVEVPVPATVVDVPNVIQTTQNVPEVQNTNGDKLLAWKLQFISEIKEFPTPIFSSDLHANICKEIKSELIDVLEG